MKTLYLSALFAGWLFVHPAQAFSGLELSVSKPHAGTALQNKGIYSLSYFTTGLSPWPGFSEWGMVAMPSWGPSDTTFSASPRTQSFVGLYGGHLFLLGSGIVRPGFELGTVWEDTRISQVGSAPITRSNLSLYYAFKVQVLCLSFLVSNKGYGVGLNFSL